MSAPATEYQPHQSLGFIERNFDRQNNLRPKPKRLLNGSGTGGVAIGPPPNHHHHHKHNDPSSQPQHHGQHQRILPRITLPPTPTTTTTSTAALTSPTPIAQPHSNQSSSFSSLTTLAACQDHVSSVDSGESATTLVAASAAPAAAVPPNDKAARMPDWNEFYKNGLPREIIVIDDTPEPTGPNGTHDDVYGQNASYHTVPAAEPSALTKTTAMAAAAVAKRKYDDLSSSQSSYRTAEGSSSSQQPLSESAGGRFYSGEYPKAWSDMKTPDPESFVTRKRLRHDTTAEEIYQPAQIDHYRGLSGPVVKSKDVVVRVIRGRNETAAVKPIDDADGHYIVIPEAQISSRYQIKKLIGQGTFGKVVHAYDAEKKRAVAVKVIRAVPKYRDAARIELRVLQTLRQNDAENKYRCIHLRDCFDFHGHICIVTDLLGSSIFDFLKGNGYVPFPNSHIQSFAKQLLTSIAFIHDLGLIHTDLKPENILLCDPAYQAFTYNRKIPSCRTCVPRHASQRRVLISSEIRLIDFGSATFQDEYHSSVVSTRHYRAPEIILGLGWSFPCDIWSIGCILVEFFTGDALFQTHDNLEHLAMMETVFGNRIDTELVRKVNKLSTRQSNSASYFKRLKLNYPSPDTDRSSRKFVKSMRTLRDIIPPANRFLDLFVDLLQKMFVYDPARRITAKQALLHPWFREVSRDDGTEATKIAMKISTVKRVRRE